MRPSFPSQSEKYPDSSEWVSGKTWCAVPQTYLNGGLAMAQCADKKNPRPKKEAKAENPMPARQLFVLISNSQFDLCFQLQVLSECWVDQKYAK